MVGIFRTKAIVPLVEGVVDNHGIMCSWEVLQFVVCAALMTPKMGMLVVSLMADSIVVLIVVLTEVLVKATIIWDKIRVHDDREALVVANRVCVHGSVSIL